MATGNESKIDTTLFVSVADSIASSVKEIERLCGEWNGIMVNLRGEWQGDASDNIKNTAEQAKKSAAELLANLSEYPVTLSEIAGIYNKTEQNVQKTGKTLKFEQTFR